MGGAKKFKIPRREPIHPKVGRRAKALNAFQVTPVGVDCLTQVVQQGSRRDYGAGSIVQAKSLEGGGSKMLGEAARGKFFGKDPILEAAGDRVTHKLLEIFAVCPAVKNHFAGLKRLQPGIDFAQGSLGCEAFAG